MEQKNDRAIKSILSNKVHKDSIKKAVSLTKSPTAEYNYQILKHSNSKIDMEKAHYEAELLLEEEEGSTNIDNQLVFQKININIFKFFCHFFEPIDWLYFILGII